MTGSGPADQGVQCSGPACTAASPGGGTSAALTAAFEDELLARVAWSRLAEPGDLVAATLVRERGPVEALRAVVAGSATPLARYLTRLPRVDPGRDVAVAHRCGAAVLRPGDPDWPTGVQDLAAPPFCLFVRGDTRLLSRLSEAGVAMVGARASTPAGEATALELAAGVAEAGFVVVSGAAYGIDAAAHQGALAAGRPTVAVLAGGVERAYPPRNAALIARIATDGAVVAEVPPGSAPTRTRFLQRNRLIATMTAGTVVVEAGLRSGSLNTARTAADHLRPVGVVPGSVRSPMSAGCHQACRDGYAVLVTDSDEVLELVGGYGMTAPTRRGPERPEDGLEPMCRTILAALPFRRGIEVGALAVNAGVTVGEALASLGRLEAMGLASREDTGWRHVREQVADLTTQSG